MLFFKILFGSPKCQPLKVSFLEVKNEQLSSPTMLLDLHPQSVRGSNPVVSTHRGGPVCFGGSKTTPLGSPVRPEKISKWPN